MPGTTRSNLRPTSFSPLAYAFLLGILLLAPTLAVAGEWRVTPIRLFFDRGAKSGILNVQNDGDAPMNLQIKAMQWTQDAQGKDQYADTSELVFFPKFLMIPPKEERVIRIGSKMVPGAREKTFRVFVEEVTPPRKEDKSEGATVFVNVRFAVPLFVTPAKDEPAAKLQAELKGGTLAATVQNTGNIHFKLASLELTGRNAQGEETFRQKIDGWYLLSGATRTYSAQVPKDACLKAERIELEGVSDRKISIRAALAVDKNQCQQ